MEREVRLRLLRQSMMRWSPDKGKRAMDRREWKRCAAPPLAGHNVQGEKIKGKDIFVIWHGCLLNIIMSLVSCSIVVRNHSFGKDKFFSGLW